MTIDIEQVEEYFKLKDQYIEKYKDLGLEEYELIPNDFFHIEDYGLKNELLKEALANNKRLEELEKLQEIHYANVEKQFKDNLSISVEEAEKKRKM